jgi:diketogulonate reductase-like aldo/keto reductase
MTVSQLALLLSSMVIGMSSIQSRIGPRLIPVVRSHIDTARHYKNESQVGEAVRESSIPREQVFISTLVIFNRDRTSLSTPDNAATKIFETEHGYDSTKEAIQSSLDNLGVGTYTQYHT